MQIYTITICHKQEEILFSFWKQIYITVQTILYSRAY